MRALNNINPKSKKKVYTGHKPGGMRTCGRWLAGVTIREAQNRSAYDTEQKFYMPTMHFK